MGTKSTGPREQRPADGDVVITSDHNGHSVQIFPKPDRMVFRAVDDAVALADRWAERHSGAIWNRVNGQFFKLSDRKGLQRPGQSDVA